MIKSLKLLINSWFSLAQLLVGTQSAIAQTEAPFSWGGVIQTFSMHNFRAIHLPVLQQLSI
jgi:hypothetical protein